MTAESPLAASLWPMFVFTYKILLVSTEKTILINQISPLQSREDPVRAVGVHSWLVILRELPMGHRLAFLFHDTQNSQ
jgi:hypothetical protein